MTYLHHVTLTTGHVRRSTRDEIAEDVRPQIAALLAAALDGQEPVIPGAEPPGCTLRVIDDGTTRRCCTVEVLAPYPEQTEVIVTVGIAGHSRCGAALWRHLHDGHDDLVTAGEPCPPEPWCAVRLEVGLALYPEAAEWLGDLERCLAWAWLDRIAERGDA